MKRTLLLLAAIVTFSVGMNAQTLYVPGGTGGIGASTNGNIGIGTSTPEGKVVIAENGSALSIGSGSLGFNRNYVDGKIYNNSISAWQINGGNNAFAIQGFNGALNQPFIILKNGNVGIGTPIPTSPLEVHGVTKIGQFTDGTAVIDAFNSYAYFGCNTATNGIAIGATGNIGIGTTNPKSLLSIVKGSVGTNTDGLDGSLLYLNNGNSSDGSIIIKSHGIQQDQIIGSLKFHSSPDGINYSQAAIKAIAGYGCTAATLAFYTSSSNTQQNASLEAMRIQGGNVLIGKTTQTTAGGRYKLDVAGPIRADEIVVNTTGADFVFEPTYKLRSLCEVESFIKQHKHLPDISPATDMQTNGVNLGDMQTKLLQKLEESTLYLIEQAKQIEALKKENQETRVEKDKQLVEQQKENAVQEKINKEQQQMLLEMKKEIELLKNK